jgi:hypothetical protein
VRSSFTTWRWPIWTTQWKGWRTFTFIQSFVRSSCHLEMAPFNNSMKGMTHIHIYLIICEKLFRHF